MPWRTPREPFLEFGHEGDGGRGERMLARVLDGSRPRSVTLAREWDLEGGLPRIGQRCSRCSDQHGRRQATVRVTRVTVVAFSEVDAEAATAARASRPRSRRGAPTAARFYEGCRERDRGAAGRAGLAPAPSDEPMAAVWFALA